MSNLYIVNQHLQFPPLSPIEPSTSSYIHVAAEVDNRPPLLPGSRRKKQVIARCKALCQHLPSMPDVLEASVFRAPVVPSGRGEFLKRKPGSVRSARYDLATPGMHPPRDR